MTKLHRFIAFMASTVLLAGVLMTVAVSSALGQRIESMSDDEFATRIAFEIYSLFPSDRDRFHLGRSLRIWQSSPILRPERLPFEFYGSGAQMFTQMECTRDVLSNIFSYGNIRGTIVVGLCNERSGEIQQLLKQTPKGIRAAIDSLVSVLGAGVGKQAMERLWEYERKQIADNIELHHFPIIGIGSGGPYGNNSIVVIGHGTTLVLQANLDAFCRLLPDRYDQICGDRKESMGRLALRIHARLPRD